MRQKHSFEEQRYHQIVVKTLSYYLKGEIKKLEVSLEMVQEKNAELDLKNLTTGNFNYNFLVITPSR